ncbi:PduM family microcompartment protein [Vibrio mimicus]
MMKLDDNVIATIAERIATLLSEREHAVYATTLAALTSPVDLSVLARHGNMVVESVDANSILALARCQTETPEVKHLLKVVSFGVAVTLVIHPSLCSMLPVKALSNLPFIWQTKDGQPVMLWSRSVLAYGDVCQLADSVVVTRPNTIVTSMAKDIMTQNHIIWSCSEDTLWI